MTWAIQNWSALTECQDKILWFVMVPIMGAVVLWMALYLLCPAFRRRCDQWDKPACRHHRRDLRQVEWGGGYLYKCRDCGEEGYELR